MIKILPSVNNIDFCGRVVREPYISKSGNVMYFDLIRNYGGGKAPVVNTFVYFKPKDGFPEFIKKGAPVIAHAYFQPVTWEDKDKKVHEDVQMVIKKVELAELVTKEIKDGEAIEDDAVEINAE